MDVAEFEQLDFRIVDENDITAELDRAVREGLVKCFPTESEHFSRQRWWHSPQSWTAVALEPDGTVASGLCIIERDITVGSEGKIIKIAGVGNVIALPRWQGTGLVDRVMALALEECRRRGFEAGLLFCLPVLERIYRRMSWRKINADVFMLDKSGVRVPLPVKNIAMTIPLTLGEFPEGDIDLKGRDW